MGWKAAVKLEESGALAAGKKAAVISTAHPAKFAEILEPLVGPVSLPASLRKVMERKALARIIPPALEALKELLLKL